MPTPNVHNAAITLSDAIRLKGQLESAAASDYQKNHFSEVELLVARSYLSPYQLFQHQSSITSVVLQDLVAKLRIAIGIAKKMGTDCKKACGEDNCEVKCAMGVELEFNEDRSKFFIMAKQLTTTPKAPDWRSEMRKQLAR